MNQDVKVAIPLFLDPATIATIESYAQNRGISQGEAVGEILLKCSQMMVTGVVEEVTEKDVFEDINRELKKIDARLSWIEGRLADVDIATVELK